MINDEIKNLIIENINKNVDELFLKNKKQHTESFLFACSQVALRQKIKNKLSIFYDNFDLAIPDSISLEQSSSELTAEYKSNICKYETSLDLTGGLGIDSIYLAKKSIKHIYIEKNNKLCDYFSYNISKLKLSNIEVVNKSAEEFLDNNKQKFDLIYIDPHRRSDSGSKLYLLNHCLPDIFKLLSKIKSISKKMLIKASPLLDISKTIEELPEICEVHIVSVANECKELLFLLDFENTHRNINYFAVNLYENKQTQIYTFDDLEENNHCEIGLENEYLYEPNASIMKSGNFAKLCREFHLKKIANNSHLFTSNNFEINFPGRIFKIVAITKYSKKEISKFCSDNKANISLRNFPCSVDEFRKKTALKDGGDIYIFGTRDKTNKTIILITKKINIQSDCFN